MNPTIQPIRQSGGRSYYLVTFPTMADRSRWFHKNDFSYHPLENCQARWTSTHNGSDFTHSLEIIPFDHEHSNNLRALCMRVYLIKLKEEKPIELPKPDPKPELTHPPAGRPRKSPLVKSSYSGETASQRELDLPVYLRYAKS